MGNGATASFPISGSPPASKEERFIIGTLPCLNESFLLTRWKEKKQFVRPFLCPYDFYFRQTQEAEHSVSVAIEETVAPKHCHIKISFSVGRYAT